MAALAEIIVNMAIAHVPDMSGTSAQDTLDDKQAVSLRVASRDQRVLLAAAIYRLVRRGSGQHAAAPSSASPVDGTPSPQEAVRKAFDEFLIKAQAVSKDTESALSKVRITRARNLLLRLIDSYIKRLGQQLARIKETAQGDGYQFVPELAYRAIRVLQALADSTIIVVPISFDVAPTVLTVRVPARNLTPAAKPFTWRRPISLLNFHNWLIRPSGHLEIDVLLPTADADRQILVHLADGMSFEEPSNNAGAAQTVLPRLDIAVRRPTPLKDLSAARAEAAKAKEPSWPPGGSRPLADLARAKEAVVADLLRHYEIRPGQASAPQGGQAAGRKPSSALLADDRLFRRTSVDRLGPRTLVARAEMIEDVTQHATPEQAVVQADVRVDDRDYFSAARTSAIMSMIVMAIILVSIVGWHYFTHRSSLSPEVAAIVLTLFVTIQADRMRRPDRTTLKGLLSSPGTLLIAPSMLPSLTLAVALSFGPAVLGGSLWAAGCIVGQALFLGFMWRGPLTAIKASSYQPRGRFRLGERRKFGTEHLDYSHFEALRSDYWRNTTAEALMLGRMAYGYVIWQGTDQPHDDAESVPPRLEPLLTMGEDPAAIASKPASVLALLHSSTQRQAITFVVFRDKLGGWLVDDDLRENHLPKPSAPVIRRLDLDPDRLAPMDNVTSKVDVFVGLHGEFPALSGHPLISVLKAARKKLIVLEAQLPFPPPPVPRHHDMQWARVRLALRDTGDIRRLTEFLDNVYKEFAKPEHSMHVLAVQADPTVRPAVIFEGKDPPTANGRDIPAAGTGDLHVPDMNESSDVFTWRMVTACAEARSNIESDIIAQLPAGMANFQLVHLNFAILHGIAVIIVLLHERRAPSAPDGSADYARIRTQHAEAPGISPSGKAAWDHMGTVINGKVSFDLLGQMVPCPLVRIRFRWQDRPGGFLNVLNSINSALLQDPPMIDQKDRSVSYARLHVATGRIAEGDLTVRLQSPARDGMGWTPALMERMARNISADAALEAIGRHDPRLGAGYPDRPENPVIRIDLLGGDMLGRVPRPLTRGSLPDTAPLPSRPRLTASQRRSQ